MTGTFDGWSKSEQLDKVGDHFEKTVTLPDFSEKVYYKVGDDSVWSSSQMPTIPYSPIPFAPAVVLLSAGPAALQALCGVDGERLTPVAGRASL